jgi:hypothetical protein
MKNQGDRIRTVGVHDEDFGITRRASQVPAKAGLVGDAAETDELSD